jgi:hypothetical protein
MSIYICEEYAEENNNYSWKHQGDGCLVCRALKEIIEIIESPCVVSFECCDKLEAIKEQILDSEDLDKCTSCRYKYEEERRNKLMTDRRNNGYT